MNITPDAGTQVVGWLREYAQRHGLEDAGKAHAALAAFGVFGIGIPPQYGGLGLSRAGSMRVMEQLGAIDIALSTSVIVHYNVTQAVLRYGSEAQKQRILTPIVSGHLRAAFSLTEQDAGSNLRGIQSYAEPADDGGFYLHGDKAWCGGAEEADVILILARMGRGGPLSTFLVDRTTPGLIVHPAHPLVGVAALRVHDISLRRAFVPRERLLGEDGQGFQVVEDALHEARLGIAAVSLGAMKRAVQWADRYTSRRRIGTGAMLDNPVVRDALAEATHTTIAVDALLYDTCDTLDRGESVPLSATLACKVLSTEWLGKIADNLVQWMGARGYHASYPAGRLYRDYRLFRIGEGPSEALLAHMGALYCTDARSIHTFVAGPLGSPGIAQRLEALGGSFDRKADPQALYSALGALVAETLAWAAASRRGLGGWGEQRVTALHRDLLSRLGAPPSAVEPLRRAISEFSRDIGSLSETVPASYRVDDPYLSEAGTCSSPSLPASDLALLAQWESGGPPPAVEALLHEMIEQVAARIPDAPAVISDEETLSYATLNARAERLAGALQQEGVTPGTLVPMLLRRTPRMVVAALGVLKAGAVLVPLDPTSPKGRLQRLLSKLSFRVVVTEDALGEQVDAYRTLNTDALPEATFHPVRLAKGAPALVIHTSGSTGQPKPVLLAQDGLAMMLLCRQGLSPLDSSDRVLQCAAPTFDISFWEYFAPLIAGACVVTPARARSEWDGAEVAARIRSMEITTLQIVPTLLGDLLSHAGPQDLASLRRIYCGGEPLTRELATRTAARTGAMFVNVYGPTETTVECTWYVCASDDSAPLPPIGRPTPGRRIYLLDEARRRVPLGTAGEITIGGVGVALGYLGDEAMTARVFVEDPFSSAPGARMYKSGDLGRYREDGTIEFLGRIDRQVKLRGVRIELGEIEQVLLEHPMVSQVVVCTAERGAEGKVLVAYLSTKAPLGEAELLEHARQRLPRALLPAALVCLPRLPLTSTGKVDQGALPPVAWASSFVGAAADANPTERAVLEIWSHVLGSPTVGLDDGFFSCGGHSLSGAQIITAVQERFGCRIRLNDFFAAGTARWLALAIDAASAAPVGDSAREVLLSLHDATRAREVPVLIYLPALPARSARHPVLLFSHGLGGTREGYAYLGRHWAENGFVSVHVQHAGSDIDVLLRAKNPMLSAMQVSADRHHLIQRPLDLSFVLSQLERLESSHPALRGRLDFGRVGAAGHSFGAFTALAMAGLEVAVSAEERRRFFDPRVKGVVALSPPALFGGALDTRSYKSVERPCLHMSGTRDDGPVFRITPEERCFSYTHTDAPEQYMVMIEGAHHFTFGDNVRWNGEKVAREAKHHEMIQRLTTVFWEAHLHDSAEARRWLREEARGWLGEGATLSYERG